MSDTLRVSNLPPTATADDLLGLFSGFGRITGVFVVTNKRSGVSREFGFVELADGGQAAVAALHGTELHATVIVVERSTIGFREARRTYRAGEGD